jgi:DNA-binding MarR family transcriptional regulator
VTVTPEARSKTLGTPSARHAELVRFLDDRATEWSVITDAVDRDTLVLFGLLEATTRVWRSVHHEALARFGLNLAEWTTIGMLRTSPPAYRRSPTELRRLVGQTSAGMTRVLAKLGRRGLVGRASAATDARRHDVILTRKGQAVADESFRGLHAVERGALAPFTADECAQLIQTLDRLRHALSDAAGETRAERRSDRRPATVGPPGARMTR